MNKITVCIITPLLFLFLFLFSSVAHASDIVINEVFPNPSGSSSETTEFIELFNKGQNPINIVNWKISDTEGAVKTYLVPENTVSPGGFIVFRKELTGISLNNTGDGLVLKNSLNETIDSMSFDSTLEDKSWSRIPNGIGDFVNNTDKTEGQPNSSPPPLPTSTPKSTPIPPTSIKISTPTKTPTPIKKPESTSTTTNSPITKITVVQAKASIQDKNVSIDKDILGQSASGQISSESGNLNSEASKEAEVLSASSINFGKYILLVIGIILISSCAILFFLKYKKEKEVNGE